MSLIWLLLLVFLWALSALLTVAGIVGMIYSHAEYQFHMLRIKVDELTIENVRVQRRGIRVFTGFPYSLEGRRIMGVEERWIWRRVFRLNTDKALPQRTRFLLGKYNRWDGRMNLSAALFFRKKKKRYSLRGYNLTGHRWSGVMDTVSDVRDGDGNLEYVSYTFHDEYTTYGGTQKGKEFKIRWKSISKSNLFSRSPFGLSR